MPRSDQSSLMAASLTTFAHFAMSRFIVAVNSSGELPIGSAPWLESRSRNSQGPERALRKP